jgi:hypothetical protein
MPLMSATRSCRSHAEATRLRKLECELGDLAEQINDESEKLRDSFDNIAATAAFFIEAMENGDTSQWISAQADTLGASLVWHSERLSLLKEQGKLVCMAMGALKLLRAGTRRVAAVPSEG